MRTLGLLSVLTMAAVAFSQNASDHPITDCAKINDALRAGPAFITKNERRLESWAGVHHKKRNDPGLATTAWRRVSRFAQGNERMDLSAGCARLLA